MSPLHARRLLRWLFAGCLAACAPTPVPNTAEPTAPPLHQGPLTDYVPAAGLRWMITARPRTIAESPALRQSLELLFPAQRLAAFAAGSGVDLRQIDQGLIAGFDLGMLYLFEPPEGSSARVIQRFRERILSGERVETPHPAIDRISGNIGKTPQMLVRLEERRIGIAVADLTAARVVEAFARKRLRESPPALRGAALSQLSPAPAEAVATFYAPGPFLGEWASGARGLLASAEAISVSLMPTETGRAQLFMEVVGELPASGADRLAEGFRDLAESSTGKLLGFDRAAQPPRVREREGRLLLDVELELDPIARGLRAAVMADVWEILDLPQPRAVDH